MKFTKSPNLVTLIIQRTFVREAVVVCLHRAAVIEVINLFLATGGGDKSRKTKMQQTKNTESGLFCPRELQYQSMT